MRMLRITIANITICKFNHPSKSYGCIFLDVDDIVDLVI